MANPYSSHQGARKHKLCRQLWGSQHVRRGQCDGRAFCLVPNSIGAHQRYTYCFCAVRDTKRQKLLLGGGIEQHPGPIAALQMDGSSLTPNKIANLRAQGVDIDSHPGDPKAVEANRQHAHWGLRAPCTSAYRQERRCWCGKLSAPGIHPSPSLNMIPASKWWWSKSPWSRTVASA
ncbi:putative Tubulin/FtsZ family, GTPase domain containing protein [Trypanosoma cruzi]|uniref:Putative Tubulin/FtsZ family, GTPase domain containing protein n=1 Tax=Trypanosoma cruzi TaxID=5693 RepID=A0A2V2WNZ9_TRYCR|nr:putative Tubulin/FtsZ family, GTPase domain containing protein [Trypanosoma cruzi]RNC43946.1 L1Tc protein [Trypanosoma cruzi]